MRKEISAKECAGPRLKAFLRCSVGDDELQKSKSFSVLPGVNGWHIRRRSTRVGPNSRVQSWVLRDQKTRQVS